MNEKQKELIKSSMCICPECGNVALYYDKRAAKGKLWKVFRCMTCGTDVYKDPKELPIGDAGLGTLFG